MSQVGGMRLGLNRVRVLLQLVPRGNLEANVFDRGRNLILSIAVVATAVGLPDLATSQQGIKGIVDTHAHLLPDASLSFDGALSEAVKVMDRYGIETTLIMSPPRSTAVKGNYEVEDLLAAVGKHPGRFRLMGGGGGLNRTLHGHADPSSVTAVDLGGDMMSVVSIP